MALEHKRLTAYKADIKSINNGMYVKQDGFTPNYVLSKTGVKLSRVRILATIVDKFVSENGQYSSITIDDGTDTIRAKAFKSLTIFEDVEKGNIIDIIGKIRLYNDEIYLVPEIVYKVEDPNMLLLRKLEIMKSCDDIKEIKRKVLEAKKQISDFDELKKLVKKKYKISPEDVEAILMSEEIEDKQDESVENRESDKKKIISLIERIDSGNGCEYAVLIKESGMKESDVEDIINELLSEGTCFEPRPGVIKML